MTTHQPGDKVWIKYNDDLGPISGQLVEILDGPDDDGMYRVCFTATGYVSADNIHSRMAAQIDSGESKLCETCGGPDA